MTAEPTTSTQPEHSRPRTAPGDEWWRTAVIYQVYPRSWADSDGDGVGDLPGITARLDHLAELGVDALWLSPFYVSPAGRRRLRRRRLPRRRPACSATSPPPTLMVARAHELGLRVIVDIVPNHTSDEHAWFKAALAAPPGQPRAGPLPVPRRAGPDGAEPPNHWRSVFGGPAWTRITEADGTPGQWYLHLFDVKQPDLDWTNPEVRAEFESILRFWLDRGVDGFRIDVAHGLVKAARPARLGPRRRDAAALRPRGRRAARRSGTRTACTTSTAAWHEVAAEYAGDRVLVAEAWVDPPARIARYVPPRRAAPVVQLRLPRDAVAGPDLRAVDRRVARGDGRRRAPRRRGC